jgi:Uncharacterized protein conserved in bacteria
VTRRRRLAAVLTALALTGCASADADSVDLLVERVRVAEAPAGADTALYFEVRSESDDVLERVDADFSTSTSLHEIIEVAGGGIMTPVDAIDLPGGTRVELEPFGDHVMLEELESDLRPGQQVSVTLQFAEYGPMQVVADVVSLLALAEEGS